MFTGTVSLNFTFRTIWNGHSSRAVDALLGGWQLSTITLVQTGPYETAWDSNTLDSQSNLGENFRNAIVRPDQIGNCNLSNPGPNGWFNLAAFAPTPVGAGRTGSAGVGTCEGPGTVTVAGGLSKTFQLVEKLRMRFDATFTNILNHPNFAPPPTDVSSPSTFGVTQTCSPRRMAVTASGNYRCASISSGYIESGRNR